jgi:2-alkyl-3-oxoalkanoate reductase
MRILVTGASGFLGRSFTEAAGAHGHDVHALVRRPSTALERLGLQPIVRDILDLEVDDLPRGLEAVVHFATGVDGGEDHIIEVAAEGTRRLLNAACLCDIARFVHVSSMSVYSRDARRHELEANPSARGAYARSKLLAEEVLAEQLKSEPGVQIAISVIRPGLVFGRGMTNALAGTAVELPLGLSLGLGRPGQGIPFLAIDDLNTGILALLEASWQEVENPRVFDVLSGSPPTKSELLAVHEQLCGRPGRTIWVPLPVALAAAAAFDGLQTVRRRPRRAWHSIKRIYDFEPAELDAAMFWKRIGHEPTGRLRSAVRAGITAARDKPEPLSDGVARRRARQLLASPMGMAAGVPVPLILVGAGRIATEMHVPALARLPGYSVSAVVDPNLALAERVATEFPDCLSVRRLDLLDDALIKRAAVVVASPGFTHHTIALEAVGRGASVLLEKPAVLTLWEYAELCELGKARSRAITVFHNYRLRPASRALWNFLAEHDAGRLVHAQLVFHSPRLELERARWMREEKERRILLMELAVHMIDLVSVVAGELTEVLDLSVTNDQRNGNTLSVFAATLSEHGARVELDLDASGTAARTQFVFTFERAICVLDLFPDGFRVLPRRAHPLDDLAYGLRRITGAVGSRFRKRVGGVPIRAVPHHEIYKHHLARHTETGFSSPFSLEAVGPTMRSLFRLADLVYPRDESVGLVGVRGAARHHS